MYSFDIESMEIIHSKNLVMIEISRSALQAHLNHGDREGACR